MIILLFINIDEIIILVSLKFGENLVVCNALYIDFANRLWADQHSWIY